MDVVTTAPNVAGTLECLDVTACWRITDKGLVDVGWRCKILKEFWAYDLFRLTNSGLTEFLHLRHTTLRAIGITTHPTRGPVERLWRESGLERCLGSMPVSEGVANVVRGGMRGLCGRKKKRRGGVDAHAETQTTADSHATLEAAEDTEDGEGVANEEAPLVGEGVLTSSHTETETDSSGDSESNSDTDSDTPVDTDTDSDSDSDFCYEDTGILSEACRITPLDINILSSQYKHIDIWVD
ncbi:hypothetical protein HK102_006222, partial [Quaeritorhiza haematococci]